MALLNNININQFAYVENGIKISLESAAVLHMMQTKIGVTAFQEEAFKENGKLYFWFSHGLVFENLPILFPDKITDGALSKRVRRIIEELELNQLIERHPRLKSLKKSFYCLTKKADLLIQFGTDKNVHVKIETDKNVRVRRTKTSESNGIETDKNVRGVYKQSKYINKENIESKNEFLPPSPDDVDNGDLNNNPQPTTLTPQIVKGKFTFSSTEKTLPTNEIPKIKRGGANELLSKNVFDLAIWAKSQTTEARVTNYKMTYQNFKSENLEKYYLNTLIDFFNTTEGMASKGIDRDLGFIEMKFMKYAHYLIDKVNKMCETQKPNENSDSEAFKVITWGEFTEQIKRDVKTQKIGKVEGDEIIGKWGKCFPTTPYKGTKAVFYKWLESQLQTA